MIIVYEVLSPSNKRYFGITNKTLDERKEIHIKDAKSGSQLPFHLAILKYDNCLSWNIYSEVKTWEEACAMEIKLIAEYNTFVGDLNCMGYNGTRGGDGAFGYKHTEEWKQERSECMMGKNNPNYGKVYSDEEKQEMSKLLSGRKFSEEHIKNLRKPKSEECKKNMKKPKSEEHKKKLSLSKIGNKNSMKRRKDGY